MQEMREDEVLLDLLDGEDEEIALPGFRFHPTDEELVGFYLPRKVEKKRFRIDIIKQLDVYKYDPWDLSNRSTYAVGEKEWYFFCLVGRKYRNSIRPNRVTESGYWKATGIDKKIIFPSGTNNCIGLKKSLVYYHGKGKIGTKTYWMMHEFRLPLEENASSKDLKSIIPDRYHEAENWRICKIFHRKVSSAKKSQPQDQKESSGQASKSDHPNQPSSLVDSTESDDQNLIQLLSQTPVQMSTEGSTAIDISIDDYLEEQQSFDDVLPSDDYPYTNIVSPFGIDGCDFLSWDDAEILF